jgi:hypothetical protein
MFDKITVNKRNKDMALMVLKESYKNGIKLHIIFDLSMSFKERERFLELVKMSNNR